MRAPTAFCPRCLTDQVLIDEGGLRRCSVCGCELPPAEGPNLATETASVARVLLKVVLIMVAIVIVIVGVLFAGCALALSGGHF